ATQGSCAEAAGTVTCELGDMAPDATATVTIAVTPTTPGMITNSATVGANEVDPFPDNNTATAETAVGDRGCGQVITRSTRLSEDIGPCPANGIIIGADNITLNLGGHTVFGFEGPSADGNAAGIRFPDRQGSQVVNGTVSGFDAGVFINRGGSNHVRRMTITDNVGPDDPFNAELGDGIAVFDSPSNRIVNNRLVGNGIFDGIGVLGAPSDSTIIWGNIVEDTVGPSDGGPAGQGIIVNAAGLGVNDGELIVGTIIRYNTIRGSGSAGIANINHMDAQIRANVVVGNGLTNQQGHGIGMQLGPRANTTSTRAFIQGNEVHGNGGDGIHIRLGALDNVIVGNNAADNALRPGQFGGRTFDLHDYNPGCDNNLWRGNTWGSGFYNPACTAFRGSGPTPPSEPEVFGTDSCDDDYDNDQDGLVDGDDPDCQPAPQPVAPAAAASAASSAGDTAQADQELPPTRRAPAD
ncbi:MAG: right-handed parallel beta-helix repeat-containing protein, partial [Actinobacteria bacterium]|nr:right-handed parallel beta-helix repeat-containing protein [Actinomycetota bacterium]